MAENSEQIAELFKTASECANPASFLDEHCTDPHLRAEVESLLAHHERESGFLEAPALHLAAESFAGTNENGRAGQIIGNYEILSLIGSGGMGDVYLARDRDLGRKVALKIIRRGMASEDIIRRFRQEERLLASLNHANIAQLYGGGITPDGVPYFAMEHVAGARIDQYCNERQLTIPGRLELFRKVCAAVQYAHQHLVVHRDIKPSNILVTEEGEPKLLDFGIGKLLEQDPGSEFQTLTMAAAVLTPEYASPEHARGDRVTTASDIYSLGVLLYELLTGQRPYQIKTHRPDEVVRIITEMEPAKPSTAVSGASLQLAQRNLKSCAPLLRGDLDNIVLMALRKEPERRYASAGQFSEDIRRHLEGRPVIARKDTAGYRAAKFIKRNKLMVAAVSLVLLALIAGVIGTSWQARVAEQERARAERRFEEGRKLANAYLFELHDAIEHLPGSTAARASLVKHALEYLDGVAREAHNNISLQRELTSAYLKIGNVQGNPSNANLGDTAGALQSYRKAFALAEELVAKTPDTKDQRLIAVIHEKMADVLAATGEVSAAVKNANQSLAIFTRLAGAASDDPATQRAVAISHIKVGDIAGNPDFNNAGQPLEALAHYRTAADKLTRISSRNPAEPQTQRLLGLIYERIGSVEESRRNFDESLDAYRNSLAIREQLAGALPNDSDCVRDAAIAYEKMGDAMVDRGDLTAALERRRKSLEIFQRLATADPENAQAQQSLGISYMHLAELYGGPYSRNLANPAEAITNYRRALDLLNKTNRSSPDAKTAEIIRTIEEHIRALQRAGPAEPE